MMARRREKVKGREWRVDLIKTNWHVWNFQTSKIYTVCEYMCLCTCTESRGGLWVSYSIIFFLFLWGIVSTWTCAQLWPEIPNDLPVPILSYPWNTGATVMLMSIYGLYCFVLIDNWCRRAQIIRASGLYKKVKSASYEKKDSKILHCFFFRQFLPPDSFLIWKSALVYLSIGLLRWDSMLK